jgi:hypothetical protein
MNNSVRSLHVGEKFYRSNKPYTSQDNQMGNDPYAEGICKEDFDLRTLFFPGVSSIFRDLFIH